MKNGNTVNVEHSKTLKHDRNAWSSSTTAMLLGDLLNEDKLLKSTTGTASLFQIPVGKYTDSHTMLVQFIWVSSSGSDMQFETFIILNIDITKQNFIAPCLPGYAVLVS